MLPLYFHCLELLHWWYINGCNPLSLSNVLQNGTLPLVCIAGVCRCTSYGQSGHYNTYDGQLINFRGICSYTLSKLKSDFTDDKCYFNAVVKHVLVNNVRVRTVQVTIGEYTLHLRPNRRVWVSSLMLWKHDYEDFLLSSSVYSPVTPCSVRSLKEANASFSVPARRLCMHSLSLYYAPRNRNRNVQV